jgi:chemotaxis regulatin CheY-phosphate phosphatase CheZ
MPEFTKAELKNLRVLAEIACNRELNEDLHRIARACRDFQDGHLDELELDKLLRHYVEGTSTIVRARNRELEPAVSVARALATKLLDADEVPAPLRRKLARRVEALEQVFG